MTAAAWQSLADLLGSLGWALLVTLVAEVAVAAAFGLRRSGLAAVALVSIITNPAMNLALLDGQGGILPYGHDSGWLLAAVLLEVIVVVVEWRLLVWALKGSYGDSRRMLQLSATMNLASVAAGIALLLAPSLRHLLLSSA
jgi:hypothetical protein